MVTPFSLRLIASFSICFWWRRSVRFAVGLYLSSFANLYGEMCMLSAYA